MNTDIELLKQESIRFAQLDKEILEIKAFIKPYQDQLKRLKVLRQQLEPELSQTMISTNLKMVAITDEKCILEHKIQERLPSVTKELVRERIFQFFEFGPGSLLSFNSQKWKSKAEELCNYIYAKENRQTVVKNIIKFKSGE